MLKLFHLLVTALSLVVFGLLVAGCGAGKQAGSASPAQTTRACRSGYEPLRSPQLSWAAVVERPTPVFRRPDGGQLARLSKRNQNGFPTVLGVLGGLERGCSTMWYRVQLPLHPNGVVGWVRARDVALASVATRIVVDLSKRQLALYRRGRLVLQARVAVGAPATPTPTGSFYVNQRLRAPNPSGAFGPGGIGISAFSTVLTDWAQGGPIAIHGTNEPETIGRAVSHGCVRARNALVERLFRLVPAGTPVTIRE